MKKDTIHFILTGGTIDSYYDIVKETAITNEHSYIPKFIPMLKLYEATFFTEVCMNGRVFAPEEVVKILSEGRFESIYTK